MRKNILFLFYASVITQAMYNVDVKSSVNTQTKDFKEWKIDYEILNLKMNPKDKKWDLNIVLKGKRQDLRKPDKVIATYYEDTRYLEKPKEFKPNGMDMLYFPSYDTVLPKDPLDHSHQNGPSISGEIRVGHTTVDEEDMDSEDGEHSHENCACHNHEHISSNDVNPKIQFKNTVNFATKEQTNDIMAKVKYGYKFDDFKKINMTIFTTGYEQDKRRYKDGDIILNGNFIHLFNDNLAYITDINYYTRNIYRPLHLELRNDLRYKYNDNTFMVLAMYNSMQLNILPSQKNFLNKFEAFYDYNKEKRRFHKFYEILDHEHEKQEQVKFSAYGMHRAHHTTHTKDDKYEIGLSNILSKKEIVKDLDIKNELSLKWEKDIKLSDKSFYIQKLNNEEMKLGFSHDNSYYVKYDPNFRSYGEHFLVRIPIFTEKSRFEKLAINNKTNINYKNYGLENKFRYTKYISDNAYKVEDKIKLDMKYLYGNLKVESKLSFGVGYLKTQGRQVNKYEISPVVDINYKYINKGLNTKVGIEQAVEYLNLNSIGEDFPSLKLQQLDGSMTIDEAKKALKDLKDTLRKSGPIIDDLEKEIDEALKTDDINSLRSKLMMSKYNLLIETYSGSKYNKSFIQDLMPFDDFNGMIPNNKTGYKISKLTYYIKPYVEIEKNFTDNFSMNLKGEYKYSISNTKEKKHNLKLITGFRYRI